MIRGKLRDQYTIPAAFCLFQVGQDLAVMVSFISLGVIRWFPMEHFVDNPKST